ncbi:hypothetical protein F5B20DRAFT_399910 [Whalleya microplaca]|nr:hypothetical protein F5B20DRAFT_399910 [Whalleya microplaca]
MSPPVPSSPSGRGEHENETPSPQRTPRYPPRGTRPQIYFDRMANISRDPGYISASPKDSDDPFYSPTYTNMSASACNQMGELRQMREDMEQGGMPVVPRNSPAVLCSTPTPASRHPHPQHMLGDYDDPFEPTGATTVAYNTSRHSARPPSPLYAPEAHTNCPPQFLAAKFQAVRDQSRAGVVEDSAPRDGSQSDKSSTSLGNSRPPPANNNSDPSTVTPGEPEEQTPSPKRRRIS